MLIFNSRNAARRPSAIVDATVAAAISGDNHEAKALQARGFNEAVVKSPSSPHRSTINMRRCLDQDVDISISRKVTLFLANDSRKRPFACRYIARVVLHHL